MEPLKSKDGRPEVTQIIDFDDAFLGACGVRIRAELLREARLLADVFGDGDAQALHEMARQLSAGVRDAEMNRSHARRLAAALKQLAKAL